MHILEKINKPKQNIPIWYTNKKREKVREHNIHIYAYFIDKLSNINIQGMCINLCIVRKSE